MLAIRVYVIVIVFKFRLSYYMNKIKEEKKFQYLNNTNSNTPSKVKKFQISIEKVSSIKKQVEQCSMCKESIKKQLKLASTLQDKQKSMAKCFQFIDQLMEEIDDLRKYKRSKEKNIEKRYRYKTEESKEKGRGIGSQGKEAEELRKEVKSVKSQRDKLIELIKHLQKENQILFKQKEKATKSYGQIINTYRTDRSSIKQHLNPYNLFNDSHSSSSSPSRKLNPQSTNKSSMKTQPNSNIKQIPLLNTRQKQKSVDQRVAQAILNSKSQKQSLRKKNMQIELMYRKSIKNYQNLLQRYQKQINKNDLLRDEKDKLMEKLKQVCQELNHIKKDVRMTSQDKDLINNKDKLINIQQLNNNQSNKIFTLLNIQLNKERNDKNRLQNEYNQLLTTVRNLQQINHSNQSKHNIQIHKLISKSSELKYQIQSLNKQNYLLNQELNKIRITNQLPLASFIQSKIYQRQSKEQQTQTQITQLQDKSTQKNDISMLNQQDLIVQLIQKDLDIKNLKEEYETLQQILRQHKQKLNRKDSGSNLSMVKYKMENERLIEDIVEKDIRIQKLEQQIRVKEKQMQNIKQSF